MCEKEWKHFLSTEIFFFFYKSKKTFFSLENLPQIWGFVIVHLIFFYFFSGHKKRKKIWRILNTSEDFFFFEAEWKKKIPLFFPLHALNWNFMFEMKWKKVSHKKKKHSHILGRKNYSVDKKSWSWFSHMRKQSDCVTEYLALLSACRPFDLLPCWALEWAAPELWLWDAAWRPTPESCWPTPSYWLPCRPLRKEEKYQLAHYKHSAHFCKRMTWSCL